MAFTLNDASILQKAEDSALSSLKKGREVLVKMQELRTKLDAMGSLATYESFILIKEYTECVEELQQHMHKFSDFRAIVDSTAVKKFT